MHVPFSNLPGHARIWVYGLDKPLSEADSDAVHGVLDTFVSSWQSHGRAVQAGWSLIEQRFICIGAIIPDADISGCGIDASVHALEAFAEQNGYRLLSGLHVYYRDDVGVIQHLDRASFRKAVRAGTISAKTVVFDPSITMMHEFENGQFERPAGSSWHATVFRIPQIASQA